MSETTDDDDDDDVRERRRKGEQGQQGCEVREEGCQGQALEEALLPDLPQVRKDFHSQPRNPCERSAMMMLSDDVDD